MKNNTEEKMKNKKGLYGIDDKLDFIIDIYNRKRLPKVLMLSGKKGIGKSTLVTHFLNYIYDNTNYNLDKKEIDYNSIFNKQFLNNTMPEVIYIQGDDFKNIKIDDIRSLRSKLSKTSISDKERFIVLDDIEIFNLNSLNALLKLIEEPSKKNNFILINNLTKPLIKTISSRSLEIKITVSNEVRKNIIESLINISNINVLIDYKTNDLSPGNFLIFNEICNENDIDPNDNFITNLNLLLNLYKKEKNIKYINMVLFFVDYYFLYLINNKKQNIDRISEDKSYVIKNINNFISYNLNQNSLINAINNKLQNE